MGGKYQAYAEYKNTGIDWLPVIPGDWKVLPLKLASANKVKDGPHETPKFIDEGIPFFSVDSIQNNKLIFEGCRFISVDDHKKYSMKCLPKQGDVLLGKAASVGKVAYVDTDEEFNVWSPLAVLTPKNVKLGKFIFYSLQSTWLQAQCDVYSNSNTQKNLSMGDIDNLSFAIPNHKVAKQIANFLDHETAKIDTLIEKQQQLIKLLKEKRQAVISHAVTKGLDPNALMRDSGVEWLGEVPEHWKVVPLKHLCNLLKDGTHLPPPRVDYGVPLLSVRNIINGKFIFRDDDSNISGEDYKKLCKPFVPQKGDVVLAIVGATLGKVAIVKEMSEFHIQRSLAIFRVKPDYMTSEGLANIFYSTNFQSILWENIGFSAQPGIYLGTLENFRLPVPPIEEQNEINTYCRSITDRIDMLLTKAVNAIKLMQERRTALISAAVTGKIDVRHCQSPEQNQHNKEEVA